VFDLNKFKEKPTKDARYSRMLDRLRSRGRYTLSIEKAVEEAIHSLSQDGGKAFVVYGEPQSGKTEMMIALTAKLLDKGSKVIVILLNDNVQLLTQNLDRFRRSGLDPAPKNFNEILDPNVEIGETEWVIFCKKNSSDLQKLLIKLGNVEGKVVIDDEADYATPNSKVNSGEMTKINELVGKLLARKGTYIGVTATPARLDVNNTFDNNNDKWVDFQPHPEYTGADVFFPLDIKTKPSFTLNLLSDTGDLPKHLREALLSFFVNVAYLNLLINDHEQNYSILIHTSGKKADHTDDYQQVVKTFNILKNTHDREFEKYLKQVWIIAQKRYPGHEDDVTRYVRDNINRNTIVVINSERDKKLVDYTSATSPSTLFTVAIGGNIVSRGVTFDNLLSMFFTRDVKHRIQQDTYIQRARMFGSRGPLIPYFELTIPAQLYLDWHRCFIFHRLSLNSIRAGNGSPVWLEDSRISAVSASSIDRTTVDMDSGEMSFEMFDYSPAVDSLVTNSGSSLIKLRSLSDILGARSLPEFLIRYIESFSPQGELSLAIHNTGSIDGYADADKERIERKKGLIGKSDREETKYPHAIHHIKIYRNSKGKARVYYRYVGSIKFLRNWK
jgi:Z1 domain/Type III restriction enzyme, res subunit